MLLANYYIGYFMHYYASPVNQVHICMIFNALQPIFLKKKYINICLKKTNGNVW